MSLTLQQRIEDLSGSVSDSSSLDAWLTEGARIVIVGLPPGKVEEMANEYTDSGSGVSLSDKMFIRAHKSGYGARTVPVQLKARLSDSSSIHYPTTKDPAVVIDKSKAYVYPSGGSVVALVFPIVSGSDYFVGGFPEEYTQGVVVYASMQALISKIVAKVSAIDSITYTAPTAPSAPSAPSFTYTDVTAQTISTVTIGDLGTVPTYVKPTKGSVTSTLPNDLDLSGIVIPVLPLQSLSDILAVTATLPADITLPTSPTFSPISLSLDFTNFDTAIETDEDIELAAGHLGKVKTNLEQGGLDLQEAVTEFNRTLEIYKAGIQKEIQEYQAASTKMVEDARLSQEQKALNFQKEIQAYTSGLQAYTAELQAYQSETNKEVNEFVNNMQKFQVEDRAALDEYIADIQNEQAEFNKELQIYQSTVQKALEQARITASENAAQLQADVQIAIQNEIQELSRQVSEYQATLGKYQTEVSSYGAQVQGEVSELQAELSKDTAEIQALTVTLGELKEQFKIFMGGLSGYAVQN